MKIAHCMPYDTNIYISLKQPFDKESQQMHSTETDLSCFNNTPNGDIYCLQLFNI